MLSEQDREQFNILENAMNSDVTEQREKDNREREARIDREVKRLLREAKPGRNGPLPMFAGKRVDKPEGVAKEGLAEAQLKVVREKAAENVRQKENERIRKLERIYEEQQRALIEKALGRAHEPNRRL